MSKKTPWIKAVRDLGYTGTTKPQLAYEAKIPVTVLDQVYDRGLAAWETSHRPGVPQHAWAMARVYSFIGGGPTSKGPDKGLIPKGWRPGSRAKRKAKRKRNSGSMPLPDTLEVVAAYLRQVAAGAVPVAQAASILPRVGRLLSPTYGIIDFASGSNWAGEIRGLREVKYPIGVAAPKIRTDAVIAELQDAAREGVPVFVDSGAFSEVELGPDGPSWPVPMSDDDWRHVFHVYQQIASANPQAVYVVAPDRVGDQEGTLARMWRYAAPVQALAAQGANIIVPLQGGARSLAEFDDLAGQALGIGRDYIRGIPMRSGATPVEDLVAYLELARPARVHLLGLGAANRETGSILRAARAASPDTAITLDSAKIPAKAGRRGGPGAPGSGPEDTRRPLTVANDAYTEQLLLGAEQGTGTVMVPGDGEEPMPFDITEAVVDLDEWASPATIKRLARDYLGSDPAFIASPWQWVEDWQGPPAWYEAHPDLAEAIEQEWAKKVTRALAPEKKRRSVRDVFGPPRRVALISCGAAKLDHPAPARELYTSGIFQDARGDVEDRGLPYFILSAKHGAIDPWMKVAPYEQQLPRNPAHSVEWAHRVVEDLEAQMGTLAGNTFEIHAGKSYADPLRPLLEEKGATVIEPLQGLQIGERRGWYKQRREERAP